MTLRDALAAALDGVLPRMAFIRYGQFMTDNPDWDVEAYYQRVSDEVFSDPAFRAALTESMNAALDALYEERWGPGPFPGQTTVNLEYAADIVARMLAPAPQGPES